MTLHLTNILPREWTAGLRAASTNSRPPSVAPGVLAASTATMQMVSEILIRLKEDRPPVIQFVAACGHSMKDKVVRDFARAVVGSVGRVLLLTPWPSEEDGESGRTDVGVAARLARLLGSKGDATIPDSLVAGLYHRRLWDDQQLHAGSSLFLDDHEDGSARFKLTIAVCPPPIVSAAALRMAKHCNGSVLIVAAGKTRRNEVEAASRQIAMAGGNVLGAILCDAPSMWGASRRISPP